MASQGLTKPEHAEQTTFSLQKDLFGEPVRRPTTIPKAALKALSEDEVVARCLKFNEIRPAKLPANWFSAAEVHLRDRAEADLVIMPFMMVEHPEDEKSQSGCWDGARGDPFWILKKTGSRYKVILSKSADALEILSTSSHGIRDIVLSSHSVDAISDERMKFDGRQYVLDRSR